MRRLTLAFILSLVFLTGAARDVHQAQKDIFKSFSPLMTTELTEFDGGATDCARWDTAGVTNVCTTATSVIIRWPARARIENLAAGIAAVGSAGYNCGLDLEVNIAGAGWGAAVGATNLDILDVAGDSLNVLAWHDGPGRILFEAHVPSLERGADKVVVSNAYFEFA